MKKSIIYIITVIVIVSVTLLALKLADGTQLSEIQEVWLFISCGALWTILGMGGKWLADKQDDSKRGGWKFL